MTVVYHPGFPKDIRRFEAEYQRVSAGLAARFRKGVDEALEAIETSPQAAGHFFKENGASATRSKIVQKTSCTEAALC